MSRSYRKPIYKDKGIGKKLYNRTIRRVQKLAVKQGKDIPNPKTIINDYDYCDYVIDLRNGHYYCNCIIYPRNDNSDFWKETRIKYSRK